MNNNSRILAGIILVAGFLAAVIFLAPYMGFKLNPEKCEVDTAGNVLSCPHERQVQELQTILPVLISIALAVGAGTYYLMAGKVESTRKSAVKTGELVLKFLGPQERKVVDLLIKNKGKLYQSEISRTEGMTKLKSHRVIQKLSDRGVIQIQENGKTNIIRFNPEIEESLLGSR